MFPLAWLLGAVVAAAVAAVVCGDDVIVVVDAAAAAAAAADCDKVAVDVVVDAASRCEWSVAVATVAVRCW